jgi:hypothetical protein
MLFFHGRSYGSRRLSKDDAYSLLTEWGVEPEEAVESARRADGSLSGDTISRHAYLHGKEERDEWVCAFSMFPAEESGPWRYSR